MRPIHEPVLVYGHPLGSSMGLIAALEWLGQPYRLTRVDMLGEMHEPAYERLNARHETPVLVLPDNTIITETMAILRWIEQRDSDRRVSFAPDSVETLRLLQIAAFINTGFTAAFVPYWIAMEAQDKSADEKERLRTLGRGLVEARHAKLEHMIAPDPWLMGDKPTLADAVFAGVARWADFHDAIDPAAYPKIAMLKARLAQEPAIVVATAIEDGEHPAGTGMMKGQVPLAELLDRLAA